MEEARKSRRFTLTELKAMVEAFAECRPGRDEEVSQEYLESCQACRAVASSSLEGSLRKS